MKDPISEQYVYSKVCMSINFMKTTDQLSSLSYQIDIWNLSCMYDRLVIWSIIFMELIYYAVALYIPNRVKDIAVPENACDQKRQHFKSWFEQYVMILNHNPLDDAALIPSWTDLRLIWLLQPPKSHNAVAQNQLIASWWKYCINWEIFLWYHHWIIMILYSIQPIHKCFDKSLRITTGA